MKINTNIWNKIRYSFFAPFYDFVVALLSAGRKKSIALLKPEADDHILIAGAGTGLDLEFLPGCNPVTAIDITPAMVRKIKSRAIQLDKKITAICMDAQKMDFADHTFDKVILHLILAVIPDPKACIHEVERVLKPGGRVVVFDKFLPDGQKPGLFRTILNVFTGFVFSEINRKLAEILQETSFTKIEDHDGGFGGTYRIVLLEKPN